MATPELLVPEFSLDDHPLVIAQKFQEIIADVEPEQGDFIGGHALDVIHGVYSTGQRALAYTFGSDSVYVADKPLDSEGEIKGGLIYDDAEVSGAFDGFHYLRTDLLRSICVGASALTALAPEALEAYLAEHPNLPVFLPVLAVRSVRAIPA